MQLEDLFDIRNKDEIRHYVELKHVSEIPIYENSNNQLDTSRRACLIHGRKGSYVVIQTDNRLELRDTFVTGGTLLSFDKGEVGWSIGIVSNLLNKHSKGELHNLRKNLITILSMF